MNILTSELDGFLLVGIETRTSPETALADIQALRQEFIGDSIMSEINHRVSDDIYQVYFGYDSDHTGPYTTLIWCPVNSLDDIPDGCILIKIPKQNYNIYTSTGQLPESVQKTWSDIWSSNINRSYGFDFDLYPNNSEDPTKVLTYVGVR